MISATDSSVLDVLLESWARNNTILLNLLHAIPDAGLDARAGGGSPSVAEMFSHIAYVRLVFVSEDAPEFAAPVPEREWTVEHDRNQLAQSLNVSANVVRDAVKGRIASGRPMDMHYDHPVLFLQHMLWHEGYHHGQIKLALKGAGLTMSDEQAGPLSWKVWMNKNERR
jgi:uncharacterized damage-inducible protein DinB